LVFIAIAFNWTSVAFFEICSRFSCFFRFLVALFLRFFLGILPQCVIL
jgi:hypothetical protein